CERSKSCCGSANVLFHLLGSAGLGTGVLALLPATREAGQTVPDANIDHVVFTGSSATGRRLAEHLGRRLVTSTLELSGCDALFVLEDADVGLTARAAWFGATVNRGQTCLASRRVLVQRNLYQPFCDALRPLVSSAMPMRLALESQAKQAQSLVRDALAQGAHLLVKPQRDGGSDSNHY